MATTKKPLSLKEKREAAAAVLQKIQAEARSATQESFKPPSTARTIPKSPEALRKGRKPGGSRKNLYSSHYMYDVEVFESIHTETLTGLSELEKFGLNSLPSSTGKTRALDTQDLQNAVRPGMTKFFVDEDDRILKVTRLR